MKKLVLIFILGAFCTTFLSCNKGSDQLNFEDQLKVDKAAIDAYITSHGLTSVKDTSGVRYVIHHLGTGLKPNPDGKVSVKYSASVLGSSQVVNQNDGAIFLLNTLILGWQIALPKIPKGSEFTLFVPSGYAYGQDGNTSVPPNSIMVFEIQLFDDDAQLLADVAAIDHYLDSLGITSVIKDPSGVRIQYHGDPGLGAIPTANSLISVTYTAKVMKTNTIFDDQKSSIAFNLQEVIEGWRIALVTIPSGSIVTLYIPSVLGYGPGPFVAKNTTIPANSNLIFDIHLIQTN